MKKGKQPYNMPIDQQNQPTRLSGTMKKHTMKRIGVFSLREIWQFRQLIRQLALRDLKTRYKVSVLGFFWSLFRPLLTIAVIALVFSLLGFESKRYAVSYPVLLLVAYIPWFFFSAALLESTTSLLANANLVKKVYCPRTVFPTAVVVSNLVNFILSLAVLLPLLFLVFSVPPSWALLQLPFIILFHTLFLLGVSYIASILNVLYRDTTQIMEFALFVWFYISPVLYDILDFFQKFDEYPRHMINLYFLNPMAGFMEWYRYIFLASATTQGLDPHLALRIESLNQTLFQTAIPYSIGMAIVVFLGGFLLFKKLETTAVDEL